LVFFTDGRPTAVRGVWDVGGSPVDGVIKGSSNPEDQHITDLNLYDPDRLNRMLGIKYYGSILPDGSAFTNPNLHALAHRNLIDAADLARSNDVVVYTIGLGNPNLSQWWKQPDCELLIEVANVEGGMDPNSGEWYVNPNYDPSQPEGGFFFAPDATQLDMVFQQVAREIVLRLTQ
jgi:hypothetical protein